MYAVVDAKNSRRAIKFVGMAFLIAAVTVATGCLNMSSFQTAEVVEEGQGMGGMGVSMTQYEWDLNDEEGTITVPAVNGFYRYGVVEGLEIRGHVWFPFGAKAGAKYQLLGYGDSAEGPDISVGLDIGYLQMGVGANENQQELNLIDIYVPLYTGFRLTPAVAIYLTPQYVARFAVGESETNLLHTAGGTVGAAFGETFHFMVEGTYAYDFTTEAPVLNAGIGLAF